MSTANRRRASHRGTGTIVQTEPSESEDVDTRFPYLNDAQAYHIMKNCPCFKCTCGNCRCEYSPTKVALKLPSSTYKRHFVEQVEKYHLKPFNCEEWKYKSNIGTFTRLNQSVDYDSKQCRPQPIIHPDYDFKRIFNNPALTESSYKRHFQPQSPISKDAMIIPRNNINVFHVSDLSHFYLKQRKSNYPTYESEITENCKQALTKPNVKSRDLQFANESSYRAQYPKYSEFYSLNNDERKKATSDLHSLDLQNRYVSTFASSYRHKLSTICPARQELDKLKIQKNRLSGQYYLQQDK